jgi:hypothetical protein
MTLRAKTLFALTTASLFLWSMMISAGERCLVVFTAASGV